MLWHKYTPISPHSSPTIASHWVLMICSPWKQGSWGQHGVHLGPTGPRWAPCWPHELCYLGWFWLKLYPCLVELYSTSYHGVISLLNGQFSPKSSQKTPHSSPVRAMYGLSFYTTNCYEIYALSSYICVRYKGTRLLCRPWYFLGLQYLRNWQISL